jgi:hypothetical protein
MRPDTRTSFAAQKRRSGIATAALGIALVLSSKGAVAAKDAQLAETQAAIARTNATYDYIVKVAALAFATGIIGDANQLAAPASAAAPAATRAPSPSPPAVARHR